MKRKKSLHSLYARYEELKTRILDLDLVLVGTITKRFDSRERRTTPGKKKRYGPYYQWTFKQKGKTVTVNLSPEQATQYGKAINNQRKLEKILIEMRKLSRTILEESVAGVRRRKTQKARG